MSNAFNARMDRRTFLRGISASAAGASLMSALGPIGAQAANVGGYKAIVCLFLKGGVDGHDLLLPYDQASYNRYADIRRTFMDADSGLADGPQRSRSALLELSPLNAASFGSRSFALPPSLGGIHSLFSAGRASIMANVGPLRTPINATQYRENPGLRPKKLFSHNDQQSTWMALETEGVRFGWGGRFADAAVVSNANAQPAFSAMTFTGNEVFLSGEFVSQYKASAKGAEDFREIVSRRFRNAAQGDPAVEAALVEHYSRSADAPSNLFARDVASVAQRAYTANAAFEDAIETTPDFATTFPNSGLGGQLGAVARTIAARGSLGASRQVFMVAKGGYDTHGSQATSLPGLHADVDASVTAFFAALQEIGVENDVLLFTASDFGRTLTLNGSGTDHGWGNHHLIVGGSIDGGKIFGEVPPYDLDHEYDTGRGRIIPTTSVEQFAAPMGRWFGLSESELATALPNLSAFSSPPVFV